MANMGETEFYQEFYSLLSPRAVQYAEDYMESPSTEDFILSVDTTAYPCFQVPEETHREKKATQVNIRVKILKTKEEYKLALPEDISVSEVRQAVCAQGAGAPETLRFLLKGKVLQDHKSLKEYGIGEGALLQAMRKSSPSTGQAIEAVEATETPKPKNSMKQLSKDETFWKDLTDFVSTRLSDPDAAQSLVRSWKSQTHGAS
ncbi:hypothetical protein BJ684DRAFT_20017 [Piptocephalis cylindrospora]|uniref:Ubiquitin-like domain-containing protein n=1 Tax=Piptocephalis cylindrospora TaxID=1907219 RepID=A0A4P9Y6M2_9FUNG|nr:hypothetical protein BJ684DRAFT_20017 [Piptocephalis cylindrospora]|eukprot:RKP13500.1 hypothetical protein BJ684DRAFT_20017 [Piptocephalis cylindrospora]